jgi:hypothetical protein
MSGWNSLNKEDKDENKKMFTKEMAKDIFEKSKETENHSSVCAALYGFDGVGKTGACMDCRTKEEMENGMKVIVIDMDDSAAPIKEEYWSDDENVIVVSPIEFDETGSVDHISSYNRLKAIVSYIRSDDVKNIKAVVLDGLGTLKNWAMYKMKLDLGMDVTGKNQIDIKEWERRNMNFYNVVIPLKNMNCDRYFIGHYKEVKKFRDKTLVFDHWEPDWLSGMENMMFQKINVMREEEDGVVYLKMKLEKSKHDLSREGAEVVLAEVNTDSGKGKWKNCALNELLYGK